MQIRGRSTSTFTHHGDGLHIPPSRNKAVHLRLHFDREPTPQSNSHNRIELHEPRSGATAIRRLTKHPRRDKTLFHPSPVRDPDGSAIRSNREFRALAEGALAKAEELAEE
ncbi:hypothetical protein [Streptomyces sp. NPDC059787]|uniref:hypothetical protein n=1 Tax=Streptomyces sp. NPDC059787 TaxID=3346947 RepID=UPI00365E4092